MKTRTLGPFTVSAIGLGCMPMSMGANVKPSPEQAEATVHAALDAGVTFLDTADIYAPSWDTMGHNERIVAKALKSWSGDASTITVATKGGITRGEGETWGRDGSPEYLRRALEASLTALERDVIDLYQWHRPDRSLPYGQVVEVFKGFQDEGLVKAVGISNANVEEIQVAIDVLGPGGLVSVQNEFSPKFRSSRGELEFCGENGVVFLPWSPLGGTGAGSQEVGLTYPAFTEIGRRRGVSPYQVVLAWELSLGEHVIPIPGASRPESITDSAKAADLELTAEELDEIEAQFN
ncbi:aldo/keto reductase [Aestuariimicrobium ganziense]|uniref:aldo/keto reductase n=1 Tax=Aestuariimicrobium ganziense TaxID=2773677 RepID=UPI00194464FA|nr:aldo/keto reductase [Aestuariimicrobium ganziense]